MKEYKVICGCCGKEFIAHRKNKEFCSRKCKDVDYKRRQGQDSRIEPRHIKCIICGKEFTTTNPTKKTCSLECSRENKRKNDRKNRKRDKRYQHTKEEYKQIVKEQAKQRAELKKIEKEWYKVSHTINRECVECGAIFYCLDTETKVTCSPECSKRYKNKKHDKRISKSQKIDYITIKKLFERDKGICYLCGRMCDWNDWRESKKGNRFPGNKYPTIDHVIPISRGGLNSWDNVRLACWKCNTQKSDNIIKIKPLSRAVAYSEKREGTKPKKTAQYSLDGELIRIWDSTAQIKRELGFSDKHIQNVCRKSKTGNAYGYRWQYLLNFEEKYTG